MSKKDSSNHKANGNVHLPYHQKLTLGQRAADKITTYGGSWYFIGLLFFYIAVWAGVNSWLLAYRPLDPYPYILLNLTLSMLAAIQGPIILMSQNRLAERDRLQAKYDYLVDRKAEREIQELQKELKRTQQMLMKTSRK
ncbi:MAG: DUF1003 domain-containing protein [Nanoarchaeota archaeon]|nr:DUF1003 domain-containing protein [Nanoarchaeota archaeon]